MTMFNNIKMPTKENILDLIKNSLGSIIGFVIGGIGGFIYYKTVGCSTGACAITSNPYLTIVWGSLLGYLIGSTFNKTDKNKNNNKIQKDEN